ncbi:sel-1 homolog 1 [Seminavis robusta]|uniref:Sel-1 homolog 1 n=1 Tax=Seminavis robusta TaxID=568900 RepID=A0A9N8DT36_9STRA|nr:sel-1 homolog 1 [Seminavis robusta]|eukprot:Sro351_g124020.1 sel-1 homolog 1 (1021) ;mRNA; f:57707-60769
MADHQQQQQPLRPALRRPGQPPRQIPRRDPEEENRYPPGKVMLIAFLGGVALLLGCCVAILQLRINQAHQRLLAQSKEPKATDSSNSGGQFSKTVAPSDPTQPQDLFLWQQPQSLPYSGSSRVTAAQAFWNQFRGISPVEAKQQHWNPLEEPSFDFRRSLTSNDYEHLLLNNNNNDNSNNNNNSIAETKFFALQRAAQLGHPQAQHVYANALASGVLPLQYDQTSLLDVADDFLQTHSHQLQEAWLNWHMAAISGHVEAAMALGHRYETIRQQSKSTSSSTSKAKRKSSSNAEKASFTCPDVLPYYQAAAHGIMDILEASPHSRAKVLPPMEKHLLYQVHLHGGTSSQLDWHNKPDESSEAIQFYHFKATRAVDPDPSAAMTLATLYHYGYRGVVQNLTLALQYYDVAAQAGSWEAAGLAGWFHVFGLGMTTGKERDLFKAHKYFRQGLAGGGLKACQERNQKKKRFKANSHQDSVTQCDPGCLNGMGLLHLFGVPLAVDVDLDDAIDYFTLAKEMGHSDAAYNLAMVTLGWKSHYVPLDEALENAKQTTDSTTGETKASFTAVDLPDFMEDPYQMAAGPSQLDMQHAVQQLMFAVQKGHLQARHRLAMLYDTGIPLSQEDKSSSRASRGSGSRKMKEVLPRDCEKSLNHYKGIVDLASPQVLHRLRKAYKDYIAGDSDASLIQYMSIAELGNEIAQVNAAFLLEQGTCLGLSSTDCHKASVRYWKAAAAAGNPEACLRVGDFYYYGKLRNPEDPLGSMWDRPFGWVQYLIFPEKFVFPAVFSAVQRFVEEVTVLILSSSESGEDEGEEAKEGSCEASSEDGTCSAPIDPADERMHQVKQRREENEQDLKMAAHYYRIAAEKHSSPRANFNLAFLHQWGLGLTQDFPLAKRHYDLAASSVAASREADLAVQIALWTLAFHEYVVRLVMAWEEYFSAAADDETSTPSMDSGSIMEAVPKAISNMIGKPVPGGPTESSTFMNQGNAKLTKKDIILAHLWSWESLVMLILTYVLWILVQRTRR